MNVVITLKKKLITAIVSGSKTIELRKSYPREFDCRRDYVIIIEKGTSNAVAWFQVSDFQYESNPIHIWNYYSIQIGMPFLWYLAYAPRVRAYYLWRIRNAGYLYTPICRDRVLGLSKNPINYTYTSYKFI